MMLKKLIIFLLLSAMLLTLISCGDGTGDPSNDDEGNPEETAKEIEESVVKTEFIKDKDVSTLMDQYFYIELQYNIPFLGHVDPLPGDYDHFFIMNLQSIKERSEFILVRIPEESNGFYSCGYVSSDNSQLMQFLYDDSDDNLPQWGCGPIYNANLSLYHHHNYPMYKDGKGKNHFIGRANVKFYPIELIWYEIPMGEEIPAQIDGHELAIVNESKRCYFEDLDGNILAYFDLVYENPYLYDGDGIEYKNEYIKAGYRFLNTEKNLLLMIEETSFGSGIDALRDFWYSKNLCIAKDGAWEFSDDNLFDIMPSDKYTILDAALLDLFSMECGFEVLYYDSSPYIIINDIMLEDFSKYYPESLFQGKYERKEIELDGETAYCYPLNMILEVKGLNHSEAK